MIGVGSGKLSRRLLVVTATHYAIAHVAIRLKRGKQLKIIVQAVNLDLLDQALGGPRAPGTQPIWTVAERDRLAT
jgi:hypothetical protein